jgi:hypothetical protein
MDQMQMRKLSVWDLDQKKKCSHPMRTRYALFLAKPIQDVLHLEQDANVIPELESLEMDMRDLSVMVKALCEGQGIDVTSIARETQGQSSHVTSPNNTSDTSLELHGGNGGNDG